MLWYSRSFSSSCSSNLLAPHTSSQGTFPAHLSESKTRVSPVGLQLHPPQLHAHGALCTVGLVRDGGAQRAHPGRGHRVVVGGGCGRAALPGRASVRLVVVVVVVLLCRVALRGQAEVRPQL